MCSQIAEALLEKNTLTVEDIVGLIGPRPFKDEELINENTCIESGGGEAV